MKYKNNVINAYTLLVTVLPIWSEHILADLPYKISLEKETGHNLYHFHPHQMYCGSTVIKVLCYKLEGRWFDCRQWRTGGGVKLSPPEIPKAHQNSAKLNPVVKTVKNC